MERSEVRLALSRVAAGAVDGLLSLVLAALLAGTVGRLFARGAVTALRYGDPDGFWRGGIPMVLSAAGNFTYGLPFASVLVLLAEPLAGRTPGKGLLRLEIRGRDGGLANAPGLWRRFAVKGVGAWGLALALAAGVHGPTVAAALLGTAALVGSLPLLIGRPTLHDVAAGTRVALRGRA